MTADKRAPSIWIGAEIEPSIGSAGAYAASCMHVLDNFVTRATGGFQAFAAANRDIAAAVADQLALLQHARGFGGADLLGR